MTDLRDVVAVLEATGTRYALIGAAAMAVHGVGRSTLDIDLLTIDTTVLNAEFWRALSGAQPVEVRRADETDPLAGVVRIQSTDGRDVDVVVGRDAWQQEIIARAPRTDLNGIEVPVADPLGLILLKLYAGGSQDAWDIEQLLGVQGKASLLPRVAAAIHRLPLHSQRLWQRISVI